MNRTRLTLAASLTLCLAGAGVALLAPKNQTESVIGEQADGSVLVSSHQKLTPIGKMEKLDGARPKAVTLSPDGKTLAVLAQGRVAFYGADGAPLGTVAQINAGPLGVAWSPDGNTVYAAQADGRVARIVRDRTGFRKDADLTIDTVGADLPPDVAAGTQGQGPAKKDPQVAGIAVSADGGTLFVALGIRNQVAVADARTGKVSRLVPVGVAPYHVALSPDGKTLAVACRGGRMAKKGEQTADSAGTPVRVDRKTDAALKGGIALVDTATFAATLIEAGRQPGGMAFTPDGRTLYAASTDDDTLLALDVPGKKVRRAWTLRPAQDPGFGQIPTDVAVSADSKTLYISLGGSNAVAVFDPNAGRVTGYLPTGWYPIALAERNGLLYVASSKGFGSRVKRERGDTISYGVHGTVGLVQTITLAETRNSLDVLTARVAENNRWGMEEKPARRGMKPVPIPERVGEPSVFKHVVYIIKENQTYDGVFGDMKEGNGDPKLCTFPEEVTPNHHALARQFVLLDNTYTSGTNSADGHQWTVSGVGNAYIEQNYAAHTRSYPYDGGDPLAYSPEGFLWTAALAKGKSVRVYGEWVNKPSIRHRTTGRRGTWSELWADYKTGMKNFEITSDTDNAALKPHLHPYYIGFPSTVVDQWRADQFIADVDRFERENKMPDLCVMLLPNDHTMGTRPGTPTPRATVADNDLALGRIVERLSKSKFWKETLILVIEDDSQFGVDHVDGHRTVALCISPYTKRSEVVHAQYNHPSFLRTIGLVLGFPAMNRFDRTALPMTACFTPTPDFRPYTVLPNRIPLDEMNPPAAALTGEARRLAEACARLDWTDVDRANSETVARAIWHSQFPKRPFPSHAYHPPMDDEEDE
jgi:DNA-binding beta-propeller fold protein YncE